MNPHQIQLIQTSWAQVVPIQDTTTDLFYQRLFLLDPSLRAMFKGDLQEQKFKLAAMFDTIIKNLTRIEVLVPEAEALARKHVEYGVLASHYDTAGEALLWALQQGLGPAFTHETRTAWLEVYGALSQLMKDAAYG